MISKLVTESAPWRIAVPMQSEPVSPPPITTTCLRAAEDRRHVAERLVARRGGSAAAGSPSRNGCRRARGPGSAGRARLLGAAGQHHRVEALGDALDRHADADMGAVVEHDAFGFHLRDAPVDVMLLHLEVGNAVGEQAAGARRASRTGAPRGRRARAAARRPGRPGPEPITATFLPVLRAGGSGTIQPSSQPRSTIAHSIVLMVTGRLDQVERAGRLARRRADAAGELREIVGRVQVVERVLPVAAIDEVVPVGDLVVHRAAGVTIRNAAVHAARRLVARRLLRQRDHEFLEMADAVGGRRVAPILPVDLEKARDLAHSTLDSRDQCTRHARARSQASSVLVSSRHCGDAMPGTAGMTVRSVTRRAHAPAAASGGIVTSVAFISASARRYSTGITLRNFGR